MNHPLLRNLIDEHDCIVIFSSSDYLSELPSNRHHFATLLSQMKKLFFVNLQIGDDNRFESVPNPAGKESIEIFTPSFLSSSDDTLIELKNYLNKKGYFRPLFWIYNPYAKNVKKFFPNSLLIFHLTENFFDKDRYLLAINQRKSIDAISGNIDFWIACSRSIFFDFRERFPEARMLYFANGVSNQYITGFTREYQISSNTIIFFGNIDERLDFCLIRDVTRQLPEVNFIFCGPELARSRTWLETKMFSNVDYLDKITPSKFITDYGQKTLAWIPYRKTRYICLHSLPLKYFEMKALGYNVLTIPLFNIQEHVANQRFAINSEEFIEQIQENLMHYSISQRLANHKEATIMNYESRFNQLISSEIDSGLQEEIDIELDWQQFQLRFEMIFEKTYKGLRKFEILLKVKLLPFASIFFKLFVKSRIILYVCRKRIIRGKIRWLIDY